MAILWGFLLIISSLGLTPNLLPIQLIAIWLGVVVWGLLIFSTSTKKLPMAGLLGLFLIILCLSTLFSLNPQNSQPNFLVWVAGLGVYIYSYNHQNQLKQQLNWVLPFTAVILVIYSFWLPFRPLTGLNLVYGVYRDHNHLGDYLALAIVWAVSSMVLTKPRIEHWAITIMALPLTLFAYSRSSYLGLAVAMLAVVRQIKQRYFAPLVIGITVLAGVFFILTTADVRQYMHLPQLAFKPLLHGREHFFAQAILATKDYPLTGIGLGNFLMASQRYSTVPYQWAEHSENIFLNLFAEAGIAAALLFLVWVIYILIKADKYSPFCYVWLTLMVMFQTDYLFTHPLPILLMFLLAGLIVKPTNQTSLSPALFALPTLLLAGFIVVLHVHTFLVIAGNWQAAKTIYPFAPQPYQHLIAQSLIKDDQHKVHKLTDEYCRRFNASVDIQLECAALYQRLNKPDKRLQALKQAYLWHPFEDKLYQVISWQTLKQKGRKEATLIIQTHKQQIEQIPHKLKKNELLKEWQQIASWFIVHGAKN